MNASPARPSRPTVDRTQLRQAFGTFATGITVVTVGGVQPHGMTANSFTSVSLDPPLVLLCIDHKAIMHRHLTVGHFGVSVLTATQEPIARYFADSSRPNGQAQFTGIDCRPGHLTGVPLISGAMTCFECEVWNTCAGGDHTIVVGRVLAVDRSTGQDALLFHQGKFRRLEVGRREVSA